MKWKGALLTVLLIVIGPFLYKEYGANLVNSQMEEEENTTSLENEQQQEKGSENQAVNGETGILAGQYAPDIQLKTLNGKPFQLSDYRERKVILNFWATWCPPCKAEMPDMQKFYEQHQDEGVEIVAVNLTSAEKNQEDIQKFIDDYGIQFTIPLDQTAAVAERFEVYSIPTSYLIDRQGVIRQKVVGPMSYDWMVNEIKKLP